MGMNVGVRTMVSSFRGALDHWITRRFAADVFVGPELLVNHKVDATLDPRVEQWVRAQPETRRIVEYRARTVELAGKPVMLVGTNVRDVLSTMAIKNLLTDAREFDPKTDAMISEPLAGRTKLGPGGTLEMRTPTGQRRFRVFGVFYDFGSERGQVMLDRATFAGAWGDDTINSLHVTLSSGSEPEQIAGRWSSELRHEFPVVASSFGQVRGEVLTVFDRTFKITEVLTWLAGGVAFCGLAGSLLALALARQRDYSLLAAVGMSGRQTAIWVLGQGVLIAWVSAAVACVSGTLLAYVLAYVIQYRSFGWSIPASPQPRFWAEDLVLATVAAMVAAVYPVYRLRKLPPAVSLRQE
jgi:putative ABC transport system permease protein